MYSNQKKGFVALTAVILLSAILLFVISSLSLQIIDEAQISSANEQFRRAHGLARACAEYVLLELSNDSAYDDDDTLDDFPVASDECTFTTDHATNTTIQITSVVGDQRYESQMEIVVSTTTPSLTVESWDEYANF